MNEQEERAKIRAELIGIIGYVGEVCEPNAKPVSAFFTDRYLNPVINNLVDYYLAKRED